MSRPVPGRIHPSLALWSPAGTTETWNLFYTGWWQVEASEACGATRLLLASSAKMGPFASSCHEAPLGMNERYDEGWPKEGTYMGRKVTMVASALVEASRRNLAGPAYSLK